MAYRFNGSSQYLELGSALVTAAPLTLACFIKADNVTASVSPISISDSVSAGAHRFCLNAAGAVANDPVQAETAETSVVASSANGPGGANGYNAGIWTHAAAAFETAARRVAYSNGIAGAAQTSSLTPTGLVKTDIACRWNNASRQLFFAGLIAEVGIWNTGLLPTEIAALASGVPPDQIQPGFLLAYLPLRDSTFDVRRGNAFLPVASPQRSPDHPFIILPSRRVAVKAAAAAAAGKVRFNSSLDGVSASGPFFGDRLAA